MRVISESEDYIRSSLPLTFGHPLLIMNEKDILGFLRGVLEIYLEYWNSYNLQLKIYILDFIQASTTHQECEHMIDIVSLLRYMKCCNYSPHFNNTETLDYLDK